MDLWITGKDGGPGVTVDDKEKGIDGGEEEDETKACPSGESSVTSLCGAQEITDTITNGNAEANEDEATEAGTLKGDGLGGQGNGSKIRGGEDASLQGPHFTGHHQEARDTEMDERTPGVKGLLWMETIPVLPGLWVDPEVDEQAEEHDPPVSDVGHGGTQETQGSVKDEEVTEVDADGSCAEEGVGGGTHDTLSLKEAFDALEEDHGGKGKELDVDDTGGIAGEFGILVKEMDEDGFGDEPEKGDEREEKEIKDGNGSLKEDAQEIGGR